MFAMEGPLSYWSYIVTAGGGVIRHLPDVGLANEAWLLEMLLLTGHHDSGAIHSATEHKPAQEVMDGVPIHPGEVG